MKKPIYLMVLLCITTTLFSFSSKYKTDDGKCMMAVTYSEMAYGQFKKAFKAASVESAQKALKKGMQQVQQASAYAAQCSCTNAETYSLTAYTTAKKVKDSSSLPEIQVAAKKAMDLSLDAMGAAQQCNK